MKSPVASRYFLRKYAEALLPVVVPLIILGAVSLYITNDFFGREIVNTTSRQLDSLKETLDQTVFELDALNLAFGSNTSIVSSIDNLLGTASVSAEDAYLAGMISDLLNAQINARPYVESVYVYLDRYPDKLFTTDMGVVSVADYPDTAWIAHYRATPASELLWTESRLVRLASYEKTPRAYFTMYRRLFPAGGGRTGVIVMNLDEAYVQRLVTEAALYPDQEVDVIGQHGNLLLTTNVSGAMTPLAESLRSTDTSTIEKRRYAGRHYYAYSSTTSRYGWRVVTIIPTERLNRIQLIIRSSILALLAVSLVIGGLLTFSLVRSNARRLATVTQLFERAERGEEPISPPAPRNDEFDYMIEALIRTFLKERYAQLQLSERKIRAENLELRALRAQINPHFLFNTLDSLYWMVYGNDGLPSAASTMIKDLASLLRYALEDSEQVLLSDEIDNARRYLAIQEHRYGSRFQVTWNLAPGTESIRVLKLMLQPLLENAIYHGLKERDAGGSIFVCSRLEGSAAAVIVSDNGSGMSAEQVETLRTSLVEPEHSADHLGLYNTNRRIQLTFGPSFGIRVESTKDDGTVVTVLLPVDSGAGRT